MAQIRENGVLIADAVMRHIPAGAEDVGRKAPDAGAKRSSPEQGETFA